MAANLLDVDVLPVVSSGVTNKVSLSDLRAKIGVAVPAGRTSTSAQYTPNNAVVNPKDFGATGDGIADDTVFVQNAINYARVNNFLLKGGLATYRITAGLLTQSDGTFAATNQDWDFSTILVDFSGGDAYKVEGGAALQRIRNLVMIPAVARRLAAGGAYVAADVGLRIKNTRVDIQADCQFFKGDGCVIESSAANSNYSRYDIRTHSNGRGTYVIGANDNVAACQGTFRAFLNSQEGFRAEDTCSIRSWDATIWAEANWAFSPNDATKYGVYIGKANISDFKIYSEQQGTAQEILLHLVNATNNRVNSFRRNKDTIFGSNVGYQGQLQYQTSDGITTRYATASKLMSIGARKANVGEYVEQTFEAGDGMIARVRAEGLGAFIGSAADRRIGVNDSYQYAGTKRIYSDVVGLTNVLQTRTINIATLQAGTAIAGRATIGGAAPTNGAMTAVIDFRVDALVLTQNAAIIASAAGPNPSTAVLQVVGGVLQLVLTYVAAQWGVQYTFNYSVEGVFINTT